MSELSEVEIGKLIQKIEHLEQICDRLENTLESLEREVQEQRIIIMKGRTVVGVVLGIAGICWTAVELWLNK